MAVTARFFPGAALLTVVGDELDNAITIGNDGAGTILVNDGAVTVPVDGGTPTVVNTTLVQVSGGAGNDTILIDETNGLLPNAVLSGGSGDDTITGGSGNDQISGDAGNDILNGGGGDDVLFGGIGDDQVSGGGGNDRIVWNAGDGNDSVGGGFGLDTLEVNGGNLAETIVITSHFRNFGVDIFQDVSLSSISAGSIESLTVNGGGGDDLIDATAFRPGLTIDGGAGNDSIDGGTGNDVLRGGDGNDFVRGNAGDDTAFLGAGNDFFEWVPGDGSDLVDGQAGFDTLFFFGSGADETFDIAASGSDRVLLSRDVGNIKMDLHGIEEIFVGALEGVDNVVIHDLHGTDVKHVNVDLAGSNGLEDFLADRVDVTGSNGNSRIDIAIVEGVVTVTGLNELVTIDHSDRFDTLVIHALDGNDTIDGSALTAEQTALVADGGSGNDKLVGGDGADVLDGGLGKDHLTGGGGNDQFVFDTTLGAKNVDTVADFSVAEDQMRLDHRIFDALAAGQLSADAFVVGKAAQDAGDRIIYNDKNGDLFYDADGKGGEDAVLFARLDSHLALTEHDFLIV